MQVQRRMLAETRKDVKAKLSAAQEIMSSREFAYMEGVERLTRTQDLLDGAWEMIKIDAENTKSLIDSRTKDGEPLNPRHRTRSGEVKLHNLAIRRHLDAMKQYADTTKAILMTMPQLPHDKDGGGGASGRVNIYNQLVSRSAELGNVSAGDSEVDVDVEAELSSFDNPPETEEQ